MVITNSKVKVKVKVKVSAKVKAKIERYRSWEVPMYALSSSFPLSANCFSYSSSAAAMRRSASSSRP